MQTAVRARVNHDTPAPLLKIDAPIRCRIQTQASGLADLFCMWPALVRVDGVTASFEAASMQDAIRMINMPVDDVGLDALTPIFGFPSRRICHCRASP